jgi:hypothetical protein
LVPKSKIRDFENPDPQERIRNLEWIFPPIKDKTHRGVLYEVK